MLKITMDKGALASLQNLSKVELPKALRNLVNDVAKDVKAREEREVNRVFDRPTPLLQRAFWLKRKATVEKPEAEVWIQDVYGRAGQALINTLSPHIPGLPSQRRPKGMERWLRNAGLTGDGDWLMPSRTMRLNRYGNVSGSVASKMLADINAYRNVAGMNTQTRAAKRRYVFGWAKRRGGGRVAGIWLDSGFRGGRGRSLQMVAVNKAPTYRKRFDFFGVAQHEAAKRFPVRAGEALNHALRRMASR